MPLPPQHAWEVRPAEAIAIQRELRERIRLTAYDGPIRYLGGTDLSYNRFSNTAHAVVVLLDYETLQLVGYAAVTSEMTFKYIPGLLSFREIPPLLRAWEQLPIEPDITLVDGHGYMHPRRMGIATHLGMMTGKPTIGCAKKMLVGTHPELPRTRGSYMPITHQNELVGHALRTKDGINPMYISPGTEIGFDQAHQIALHAARGYRLPEPTRQAHLTVNQLRRGELEPGFLWL